VNPLGERHVPTDFRLPELGENVSSGDVLRVLVAPGDRVARDQVVLELETDKATIEVPSSVAGTVTAVHVKERDKVSVGDVIFVVDGAEAAAADGSSARGGGLQPGTAADAPAPRGAGLRPGRRAEAPESPEPSTGDAPAARGDGGPAGERAPDAGEPATEAASAARESDESTRHSRPRRGAVVDIHRGIRAAEIEEPRETAAAGPAVRRLARELGVDIDRVSGSAPGGRITPEDVKAHARRLVSAAAAGRHGQPAPMPLPDFSRWGAVEREPMRAVRRKTAERLSHAWSVIPHVTQHDRADITALDQLRRHFEPEVERAGGRLTVTAVALKVAAAALKAFPRFNASVDMAAQEIVLKKYVHIGVAVDTGRGLLVPVIRDVDRKNILQISVELTALAEKARKGGLGLDEMEGGSFTITNLGGFGGTAFTPIVNYPEVAILGLSRASREPVFVEGRVEPRLMLPLSLSYDHRVIDGADAVRFLRWIARAFEEPFLLALQG
jgi:pyruvate dehydrogenase E2 component (dihydrolipoamide acetyltransferase)